MASATHRVNRWAAGATRLLVTVQQRREGQVTVFKSKVMTRSIGIPVVLAVASLGLYLALSSGSADPTALASLQVYDGGVDVAVAGADFAPAVSGMSLGAGDTVRTDSGGRAAIEYFDGSVTRLDHDTTFTVAELTTVADAPGSRVIVGDQSTGSTYSRVAALTDSLSRFDIVTPTASASVQGTIYLVVVDPDGSTTVAVMLGKVGVTGNGSPINLDGGFMVTIGADGIPGVPVPIPIELLEGDWLVFNRCHLDAEVDCSAVPTTVAATTTTVVGSTTTSTTAAPAGAPSSLQLNGSAEALGPGCARTFSVRLLDAAGRVIDDDTTLVTFTSISSGGSVQFVGGGSARATNGVAYKTVIGDANGVVKVEASVGGKVSNGISFTVVPPRC